MPHFCVTGTDKVRPDLGCGGVTAVDYYERITPPDIWNSVTPTMIGEDFCEARTVTRSINGVVRTIRFKGWQTDPKTGQKIETDF